jgi:DNA-binding Lrp family transcriptional regulator
VHRTVALDGFDLRLLMALQEDGRLTNQQVGDRIGLSPSQCSRRRQALEASGLIGGYRAELDAAALGLHVLAFIQVTLTAHSEENSRRFREMLAGVDAIQEAYAMTGDTDYLLKAYVPDLAGLSLLVNGTLLAHASVARVRSSIVLDRLKESGRLPLAALAQGG